MGRLAAAAVRLWALPYTALGLAVGLGACLFGGAWQVRRGVFEFYGPGVQWLLGRLPNGQFILAMTLGHTVLGQTAAALDLARDHEHVHVRQFERWGLLMGPAYLAASAWAWLRGGRAYRDNAFEREAYGADDRREAGG